jgi:hypothetical protein
MISLLSFLYSLWTASRVNGSLSVNDGVPTYLGLHHLHTQEMGGLNRLRNGPGRPAQVHPSPVRSPFRSHGSSCHFALSPLQLRHLGDVILASKIEGLLTWGSVFYVSILEDVSL